MFLVGFFYLVFERTIAKGSGHPISVAGARLIMGIQVFTRDVHMVHFT